MTRILCVVAVLTAQSAAAQTVTDRMLCEWIPSCTLDETCEESGPNPIFSLERIGEAWLWDPLAEWNGFPVGVAETLAQADALALDEATNIGLILVPAGRTDDGALILDGYGLQYFPERALAPRAMRHHCVPASGVTS